MRALTAALTATIAVLAVSAPAAQAVPGNFWGVVGQAVPSVEEFDRLKRGGVDSIRVPVDWGSVQPVKGGAPSWVELDAIVKRAVTAGVDVLPFITSAPNWAVPSVWVPGSGHTVKAPSHLPASGAAGVAWSSFLQQAVARYGPSGAFWVENPSLPPRPLRAWQIWNEENFKYFVAKPNPAEYGKLVKLSYAAVKSVDPGATVVLGGMFARPKGGRSAQRPKRVYFASDFLEEMYETTPGIKTKFNGVALHPYTSTYQSLRPYIEETRSVLTENGDAGKGLWITELGWSSQKPVGLSNVFAKGVAGQAKQLRGAFSLLKRMQVPWKVKRVYWFSVDDRQESCNFCDGSGLFSEGFKPKKAWYEYVKFAGGTP